MKKRRVTEADVINMMTERFLYNRFKLLAMNMFEWTGLEDLNMEERHIEKLLFDYGKAVFVKDPTDGHLVLQCQGLGANVYNDPIKYQATGFGYSKVYKADECVLIENNKLRMPTKDIITYFTNQLYEVARTRDVNVKTLKLPFVLACNDKNLLTVKKALEDIDNNVYALITDKGVIDLEEALKVLNTGVKPYTAELTDLYHDIMNEALTYLGINNANTDKRERLITDEANANNQFIESCSTMFLEARQRACEKINKMFRVNISVKLRNQGGEDNEAKYDSELAAGQQQSDDDNS